MAVPRIVVALGGNAIAPRDTGGTADQQTAAMAAAVEPVADLVASGLDVVLTHGNGPQVGNLLLKNELAADVVPAMPLDWCVAQTQATIGFTIVTKLGEALARRGIARPVVAIISRVLVDADDPAFDNPTKPIGRWRPDGTRRLVPSPVPLELLDGEVLAMVMGAGGLVVAAGGGGIPMVRRQGRLVGVEAVIDKDRAACLLATTVAADRLVILTDVRGVAVDMGTPRERWLTMVTPGELRRQKRAGQFPEGSMGPKVDAVVAFVEQSGGSAAIGSLEELGAVVAGDRGTQVVP